MSYYANLLAAYIIMPTFISSSYYQLPNNNSTKINRVSFASLFYPNETWLEALSDKI